MDQFFRTHRQYQLLAWIDALESGYRRRDDPGSLRSDDCDRPPTVPNLAYYLVTEGAYRRAAVIEQFGRRALRGSLDTGLFRHVKRDITRHLRQYNPGWFDDRSVRKSPENHVTIYEDIETRRVTTTAYPLSASGETRLERLAAAIEHKRDLPESGPALTVDGITRWEDLEHDSFTVPVEQRVDWTVREYTVPRIRLIDTDRDSPPTLKRSGPPE